MARLNFPARIFWLGLNLVLGLLPSLLFFAWIERNASLPILPLELKWPWVDFAGSSPVLLCLFNALLFLLFGAIHSRLAQEGAQASLKRIFPVQAIRTVYLTVTGLSLLLLMGLWQSTGIVLWVLPISPFWVNLLSIVSFYSLLSFSFRIMHHFDGLSFLGLRQIYQRPSEVNRLGNSTLIQTGIYAWVRHPIYTFTGLAIVLTPFMTLDRMTLFLASCLYLSVGIPIEERKLVKIFGKAYRDYQKRVPAVVPTFY